MTAILTGLAVAGALTGLLLLGLSFLPKPQRKSRPESRLSQLLTHRLSHISNRQKILLGAGLVAGVIATLLSGSVLAIVIVPAGFIVIPWLLSNPPNLADIKKLEALEAWARSLGGLTQGGIDLERAIKFSLTSAPPLLIPHIELLIARIRQNFSTEDALERFADELNDGTADRLIANLILTAEIRTGNLSDALEVLAEGISEEVSNRRKIEAERSGPRRIIRIITVVVAVVVLGLFFNGSYMAAYNSFGGQLILAVLVSVFFFSLVWMRQMGVSKSPVRILRSPRSKS